jgi:Protein of unknown function (DUF3987)
MKVTITDFGDYAEELWEPDQAPKSNSGNKTNGHAANAGADTWPILNRAAYHGLAGHVVATILPHTESDPVALLLQYLVSFGNVVGRQPYYLIEGAEHYPTLYALLAGPTAKARKGTSAQHIRRVIAIADPDWARNNVASGISSGEGILHAIHDPIYGMRKGVEELIDLGIEDKRLLLDEREFSSALDSMKREGNVVSRIIRDAWDCPVMLRTLTKHSPTRVTRPHISVTGHITISELQNKLDQTSVANGFANRFLYACIRRSKLLPHGGNLDDNTVGLLGAATLQALTTVHSIGRVTMAPEAARLWVEVYAQLTKGVPGLLGDIIARADAQTLRLALLYALLDQSHTIEHAHLEAALALWDYCEASARYIFGDFTGDPVADAILRALRNAGSDGMGRWEISNLFSRHASADKVQAALGKLLADGKTHRQMQTGKGRPREVWFAV